MFTILTIYDILHNFRFNLTHDTNKIKITGYRTKDSFGNIWDSRGTITHATQTVTFDPTKDEDLK